MNKNATLATVFLLAGTLLTTVIATAPTAFAEGDGHKDKKKYKDGYDSNNKNKAVYQSAASIADCDKNYVKHAGFKCIAIAKAPVEPETATLEVCKGFDPGPGTVQITVNGNNPDPSEFELEDDNCEVVTIGPGTYEIIETLDAGLRYINVLVISDCESLNVGTSGPATVIAAEGEIEAGESQSCTLINENIR